VAIDRIHGWYNGLDEPLPTVVKVTWGEDTPYDEWPVLATYEDTGPIFGLAYDGTRGRLYAAARPRSGALLGDRRPGQIYELLTSEWRVNEWASLPAGPMEREVVYDHASYYRLINRWGVGDIEVDSAGEYLFAVNLYDRLIYRLRLPDGQVDGSFDIGSVDEPWAANAQPFGLGWHEGWLYHGVVDSRADASLPGNLAAYVYRSRADGSDTELVLSYAFVDPRWQPWTEPVAGVLGSMSHPMLVDIEFTPSGDIVLGIRDRAHDVDPRWTYQSSPMGALLLARSNGDTWAVDRRHYDEDTRRWDLPIQGGLSAWWGDDTVVAAALGVLHNLQGQPREQDGAIMFDNQTGKQLGSRAYAACWMCQPVGASLGDIETWCERFATATPTPSTMPTITAVPSSTPSPSQTCTATLVVPTATSTPTPTPTPIPRPCYLPLALRESCEPEFQRSDIALVIDTSSSMAGQKIDDARNAALSFVGMIDLGPGRSQVSVVRFDRESAVEQELTRSRALLESAIRGLRVRSGTHIDKGLRTALDELQSPRRVERNTPVVILLTDGVQTGTPGEELRAAAEVRAAGVRVYTIGLGADVDEATLRTIAGAEDRYYFAPDSGDLARIYGAIALDMICPGVDLWGGQ
jgi:uncharacterized protein YegL